MPDTATAPEVAPEAPTIDVALLRKELEWATAEAVAAQVGYSATRAGGWAQRVYAMRQRGADENTACGSAFCIAGRTVVDTGHEIEWQGTRNPGGWYEVAITVKGGETIAEVARVELGLTHHQASILFSSSNSIRDLWAIAAQITGGEITPPPGVEVSAEARAWFAALLQADPVAY